MPSFFEVYGYPLGDKSDSALKYKKSAKCPFTEGVCDGGGNRHQTKIKLKNSPLDSFFKLDDDRDTIIPGVCSIEHANDLWIVCPRRLLGFQPAAKKESSINHKALKKHEESALLAVGLPSDTELGVWSEIYLKLGDDESSINYHFDFIVAPINRTIDIGIFLENEKIENNEEKILIEKSAKKNGYLTKEGKTILLPDISSPLILEVMTASTSGSDTSAGTNISSAFEKSLLGKDYSCPGINKRQVWGRMATQLFAKSALAHVWNGKTVWLVQDSLLKDIVYTTKLVLENDSSNLSEKVNFLSMGYEGKTNHLMLKQYVNVKAGLEFEGSKTCTDILLPKTYPPKKELLKAMLRRAPTSIIKLSSV